MICYTRSDAAALAGISVITLSKLLAESPDPPAQIVHRGKSYLEAGSFRKWLETRPSSAGRSGPFQAPLLDFRDPASLYLGHGKQPPVRR